MWFISLSSNPMGNLYQWHLFGCLGNKFSISRILINYMCPCPPETISPSCADTAGDADGKDAPENKALFINMLSEIGDGVGVPRSLGMVMDAVHQTKINRKVMQNGWKFQNLYRYLPLLYRIPMFFIFDVHWHQSPLCIRKYNLYIYTRKSLLCLLRHRALERRCSPHKQLARSVLTMAQVTTHGVVLKVWDPLALAVENKIRKMLVHWCPLQILVYVCLCENNPEWSLQFLWSQESRNSLSRMTTKLGNFSTWNYSRDFSRTVQQPLDTSKGLRAVVGWFECGVCPWDLLSIYI